MTFFNVIQFLPPFTIHHFETLGSTNDTLKAMRDAAEFTCVTADEQTAGRGRAARSWYSEKGTGLYLSVLFCPGLSPEYLPVISLMTGVAVAEAIREIAPQLADRIDIKWPNDLHISGRKTGGILCEGISGTDLKVIAGIGTNLNQENFPGELDQLATSVFRETGRRIELEVYRNVLLERLAYWYDELSRNGPPRIIRRWQELSSYGTGKEVRILYTNETREGVTCGLTENGALLLRLADGTVETVVAGEIEHLRPL